MASNFVPMLSSSPPPLDDCPDDDDEEFGNFTSANIPFDSSFESPVATNKHKPYKSGDNGINDVGLNNDFNSFCPFAEPKIASLQNHVQDVNLINKISQCHTYENDNHIDRVVKHCSESVEHLFAEKSESYDDSNGTSNSLPDDKILDRPDFCQKKEEFEDPELLLKTLSSNCSMNRNVTQDRIDLDNIENDEDSSDSISVETSQLKNELPSGTWTNSLQADDSNPRGLFVNSNFVDCDGKSGGEPSSDISPEENGCATENLEFPVDFQSADSFEDFDDFQQAIPKDISFPEKDCELVIKDNIIENNFSSEFETDFNCCQEIENCDPSGNDEFADFQAFDKTDDACKAKSGFENYDESKNLSDSEEFQHFKGCEAADVEFEEFDDFQTFSTAPATQSFANFDSGSLDQAQSDSPEFADFESASFSSVSDEAPSTFACAPSGIVQDKNVDKISTVINAIFPSTSEYSEDVSCDLTSGVLEQSNKSLRLWEKLHEVEQTPGARFQWGISHSFQQLLRSVNVDYHSILRTSSVPIFASSLSLLEPVKGQISSVNAESEDRNQSPRDPIPPVEFDWTSSGLVNPLDLGQAASTLMDLSFLATADTATSSSNSDHSFENELLKPSPLPACADNSGKTLILEELLSKNVCSLPNSKTSHRPPNMSQEATSVLDQLPDLSFMRAKVLMFPISSNT